MLLVPGRHRRPRMLPSGLPPPAAAALCLCVSIGKWVYYRDGHDLHTRLVDELQQLTGHELDLSPCYACGKLNTCAGEQWCGGGWAARGGVRAGTPRLRPGSLMHSFDHPPLQPLTHSPAHPLQPELVERGRPLSAAPCFAST